ncbi:hypothetical protein BC939DRAFT_514975 [Gamsiella multidivaricata]|uniref:uncharacterized protein n=1 Tax=Gamsiella multidivaricata TaxID=101098 RepID=UPI00221EB47F|nr:uncharacterized protein BC939DRAFT_514975 [Gamsiella multidivaricata]KAI7825665.1 hypothetical protein BC939DRAFT_514975 [Gamsiella multidivaricata]
MEKSSYLRLDDGTSCPAAYQAQITQAQGPAGALEQIFGYMPSNGFRYGVLSTYTQTWFIKRVKEGTADKGGRQGLEWQPDSLDNPTADNMLTNEQPEYKAAKRGRDWEPRPGGSFRQGMKSILREADN